MHLHSVFQLVAAGEGELIRMVIEMCGALVEYLLDETTA